MLNFQQSIEEAQRLQDRDDSEFNSRRLLLCDKFGVDRPRYDRGYEIPREIGLETALPSEFADAESDLENRYRRWAVTPRKLLLRWNRAMQFVQLQTLGPAGKIPVLPSGDRQRIFDHVYAVASQIVDLGIDVPPPPLRENLTADAAANYLASIQTTILETWRAWEASPVSGIPWRLYPWTNLKIVASWVDPDEVTIALVRSRLPDWDLVDWEVVRDIVERIGVSGDITRMSVGDVRELLKTHPATVSSEPNSTANHDNLNATRAHVDAFNSFRRASDAGHANTDAEAYAWLKENDPNNNYQLPAQTTWQRYLRGYRAAIKPASGA